MKWYYKTLSGVLVSGGGGGLAGPSFDSGTTLDAVACEIPIIPPKPDYLAVGRGLT